MITGAGGMVAWHVRLSHRARAGNGMGGLGFLLFSATRKERKSAGFLDWLVSS
jgi:hypothetical protein